MPALAYRPDGAITAAGAAGQAHRAGVIPGGDKCKEVPVRRPQAGSWKLKQQSVTWRSLARQRLLDARRDWPGLQAVFLQ
jgi:hypothetical protein